MRKAEVVTIALTVILVCIGIVQSISTFGAWLFPLAAIPNASLPTAPPTSSPAASTATIPSTPVFSPTLDTSALGTIPTSPVPTLPQTASTITAATVTSSPPPSTEAQRPSYMPTNFPTAAPPPTVYVPPTLPPIATRAQPTMPPATMYIPPMVTPTSTRLPTPTSTATAVPTASARLSRVERYGSCHSGVWIELSGFSQNSLITVYSEFYNLSCETGQWYSATWTQTYSTRTDSLGNLVIAYQISVGNYKYTFTDESGRQQSLSFTVKQ
jgi:hypothetical protein